jgi:hypothetical protein
VLQDARQVEKGISSDVLLRNTFLAKGREGSIMPQYFIFWAWRFRQKFPVQQLMILICD